MRLIIPAKKKNQSGNYQIMNTCNTDTLQKVLVESRDHGALRGLVVLDELGRAEDTATGLALAGDVGASGNRNRVHCGSHG